MRRVIDFGMKTTLTKKMSVCKEKETPKKEKISILNYNGNKTLKLHGENFETVEKLKESLTTENKKKETILK